MPRAAAHAAAERFVTIQLAPAAIAYGFGATPRSAQLTAAVAAILALAAAVLLALRFREPFARFTAWSALVLFVAIFLHEHDPPIAYPAALWCALRTRATGPDARAGRRAARLDRLARFGAAADRHRSERARSHRGVRRVRHAR